MQRSTKATTPLKSFTYLVDTAKPSKTAGQYATSFLATGTTNSPADLNFHLFMEYDQKWGMGLHYSPEDEMGMMMKMKHCKDWNLYYQYNFPLTDLVYVTRAAAT